MAVLLIPAGASAATKTVDMGLPMSASKSFHKAQSDVNDYYPHRVTIHVGDKVTFVPTGFHTVDLPPRAGGAKPLLVPSGQPVAGANDAAGSPFWFNGLPKLAFNPAIFGPGKLGKSATYDGSKRVESGAPTGNKPKPMTVRFTKAGTFTYLCDIHQGMKGVVRVAPRSRPIPSARADARTVKTQLARDLRAAKALARTRVPAGTVSVGAAAPHGVEYFGFLPRAVTVPVGTTLRFAMASATVDVHTATTGPGNPEKQPKSYLGKLAASLNGPAPDQALIYASDPPGAPASLTPAFHGNGFWNSGVMDGSAASPPPSANAVTFSAAGTYQFYCMIHPFMHGTVTVQ